MYNGGDRQYCGVGETKGGIQGCRRLQGFADGDFPLSRWNINVNSNGARVPVHPAVKIPMNCATNIEKANDTLNFPNTKAMAAIIKPIAIPRYSALMISVRNHFAKLSNRT